MSGRKWMRFAFVAGSFTLLALLGAVFFQPMSLLRVLARRNPRVLYFVPTREKVVALTIDDFPHADVSPHILDVLRDNGAHATFFVIGDHVPGNELLLERARQEGHELGNHLLHEAPSIRLSPSEFRDQMLQVDRLIADRHGQKWFRPGSGWFNSRMLDDAQGLGYRCALGSVYPFDGTIRSQWLSSAYIRSQLFPGAVIILHDGKPDRLRAANVLRTVLPELRAQGYRVVTLSELMEITSPHRGDGR